MQRDFYRIKEICIDLGITPKTLRKKIKDGLLPPLERPFPLNSKYVGYSSIKVTEVRKLLITTGQNT